MLLSHLHAAYQRQSGRCFYCNSYMWLFRKKKERPKRISGTSYVATIDHRIPLAKGGGKDLSNLVAACWSCNQAKRDQIIRPSNFAALQSNSEVRI